VGPKTGYRIAVVGDSITWGQGIEEGDRFSNLMQDALGPAYEVLNFGRPGNNMPDHLHVLDQVLPLSPDFVVLQLYINDFEMAGMIRPRAHRLVPWPAVDAAMLRSSVIYTLLGFPWWRLQEAVGLVDTYPRYMERHLGDANSADSQAAFGMLRQFIDRARAAGVDAGAVLFAYTNDLGDGYPFGYLHERVREVCRSEAIRCVDLREAFAATFRKPQTMWVSPYDQHPNARANRRAAEEILREFGAVWHQRTRASASN
jgi:lysophospholipase L1-like esterase